MGTPAGGSFATVAGLVSFAGALQGDRLLSPACTHLTTSGKFPVQTGPGPVTFLIGYGPRVILINGQLVIGNNGGWNGVSTTVDWFPGGEWVAAILCNYEEVAEPVAKKIQQLVTALS